MLDYWGFFPTSPVQMTAWGRIPAMGLGSVAESAHPDIAVGGRYFGFYPMATDVVIDAAPHGSAFRDVGPHRAEHAATYTDFRDVTTDVMFRPEQADEYLLLWGVFMTSFLVDDYLADNDFLGATQTLVTSASSKTSICLAQCLAERDGHRCIGLTSRAQPRLRRGPRPLRRGDHLRRGRPTRPDVRRRWSTWPGSGSVRAAIHTHFADALKSSLTVGATHWQDSGGNGGHAARPDTRVLLRPRPIREARRRLGADELDARIARSFHRLLDTTDEWLTVEHRSGPEGVESVYRSLLDGERSPQLGYVVSMNRR